MSKSKKQIFLIAFLITLTACARPPVEGVIYVIKGDGSITPAAAIEVLVLPFSSRDDFEKSRMESEESINEIAIQSYLQSTCSIFSEMKQQKIAKKSEVFERYSPQCQVEKNKAEAVLSGESSPKILDSKISMLSGEKRVKLIEQVALNLQESALEQIEVSFDYTSEWGSAIIQNNSQFWISSEGNNLVLYVDGFEVSACRQASSPIAPGEQYEFSLGECYERIDQDRARDGGAKICKRVNKDFSTLCIDELAVSCKSNLLYMSDSCKQPWVLQTTKYRDADFKVLAEQTPEVGLFDKEVTALKQSLRQSRQKIDAFKSCTNVGSEISSLEEQTCPTVGSNRQVITTFLEDAQSVGIDLRPLPPKFPVDVASFSKSRAVQKVKTNIDGKFTLDTPPTEISLLYAKYEDNFNQMEWLLTLSTDDLSIELNNSNAL